ncbi:hypothetical protein P153DRAFT_427264 [Dothidotthia symphoricarpi CBS 119687]|uniref:Mid2 domain-containing protein n=1 Tax=Dothidotthia symphoricarpi CBS 119687 TaxID=1392245 RepID=A0A6A6ATS4_9PLEO|nr:uncharacterized protein P153DRAFT_427264 [Dothidotthia symphoricarpi CBS 119687]KAF2134588.1 hypothetical protein P153DRAFT_427264 [Dothidotthia symphoricarpi CBS 119687]
MATPRESITTVNGRRCTRSRARFSTTSAVISETSAVATQTQITTSTVAEEASQIRSSAISSTAPPSLSPPEASSSSSLAEQPVLTSTTEVAVSSALGTDTIDPISRPPIAPLVNLMPPVPVAGSEQSAQTSATSVVPSRVAGVITVPLTSLAPVSDTIETATPAASSTVLAQVSSGLAVPTAPTITTSSTTLPALPSQPETPSESSSTETSVAELPQRTNSVVLAIPTGGQAGVVAPEQNASGGNGISGTDIKTIVGGTVGGLVGLVLLGALLLFCLRRRKSKGKNWNEKEEDSRFMTMFVAKLKGNKTKSTDFPYEQHVQGPSASSVYATRPHGRNSSKLEGINAGRGIKGPVRQNSNGVQDPFADPGSPANVQLLRSNSSGPLIPQLAATAAPRSPFASLLEEIEGAPGWLRDSAWSNHRRTQSSASALNSHPPSSVYSTANDPFRDPPNVSPTPGQRLPPNRARHSSNVHSEYMNINTKTAPASRDSDFILFGEPGPSRPATGVFTPVPSRPSTNTFTPGRTPRQSDPFDLDRPEVLGFRNVISRMVSVGRQPTQSRRASSVGNWGNGTDSYYGQMGKYSPTPGRGDR